MDPWIKSCLNRTRKIRLKRQRRAQNKFEKNEISVKCLEKLCKFRRKIQFLTQKNSQNQILCVWNVFSLWIFVILCILSVEKSFEILLRSRGWKKSGECNDSNNDSSEMMTHPTYWNATKTKLKRNKIEMIKEIRGFDHPIREYLALNSDEEVQVLLHRCYTDTTLVLHR